MPRLPPALTACLLLALLCPAGAQAAADGPPRAGLALAQDKGCVRCHDVARHYVGPAFQQVADRYRGDPGAAGRLAGRIRQGSVGEWGRVIMPRQPQVSAAEATALATWITGLPAPDKR
ncbi:c-type cytochrome [Paracidovorax wautersii]|uniref:c-type cytochrome n=1 Tax=Paracidovorax wautersii TaxID=1177982 RepID=UPI0031CEB055